MIVKILSLLTFFKIICFSDVDQDQGHQLELGKTLPVTREQNKNDSILGKSMEDEMRRVDRFDENEYEDEDGEDEDDEDEDEDDVGDDDDDDDDDDENLLLLACVEKRHKNCKTCSS